ncbi:MAG: amino acid permease [Acidobacteria bacterium]|nr:amino acid permease [Acidobacteriota bacterium]
MASRLFARKPLALILADTEEQHGGMQRRLGRFDLLAIGIGAIIGAGIFVLSGVAARDAGPSVVLSFVLAGLACAFAALCYSELAAFIPVAGSAYTYTYASLGELVAWVIGWDLVLEYGIGAAMVASGWSKYALGVLESMGIRFPVWLANDPWSVAGGFIDLPALLLVMGLTGLVLVGIRESARLTRALVVVKVTVVLAVIVVGAFYVNPAHWNPFMPFGAAGTLGAAALVFVAYLGFDVVCTTAEEVKDPQRNLPVGIIGSLVICSVLYIGVSVVLTGMVPYTEIQPGEPIAQAFQSVGLRFFSAIIAAGAIAGLTSVLVANLIAQPRVLLAMSRDGLLPRWASRIHPRFGTPTATTLVSGTLMGLAAAFVPIEQLAHMESIGTLFAFILVCAGVFILRRTDPDAPRPYRVPFFPFTPVAGVLICLVLMFSLSRESWLRLLVWFVIGLVLYLAYGRRHSRVRTLGPPPLSAPCSPDEKQEQEVR